MIQKALVFLENQGEHDRLGGKSLMGLALLKGERPADHPLVQRAIEACQKAAQDLEMVHSDDVIYDLGLAIIFLSEADPEKYRAEIRSLVQLLVKWQKPHGGWGYLERKTGDTSMTQYAVLALWSADRSGAMPVPADSAARVANWLIRTQDPSGGWGYQGNDPGGFQRISQAPVQQSLSAAGTGSTYVLGDLLRLTDSLKRGAKASAVRVVAKPSQRPSQGPLTGAVDRGRLVSAMQDGDRWFASNFVTEPPDSIMYYLYAYERYQSFRELALGLQSEEARWYDEVVEYLRKMQKSNGSWVTDYGPSVDTSFGVLFLVRGTKKAIEKAEAFNGRLRGGRGLPGTADVTVGSGGQVVKSAFRGQAEGLLSLLEAAGGAELEDDDRDFEVTLSSDPQQRERELHRLRRLVSAEDYVVRSAALKALVSTRELDNVPTLIFALGDPDSRIVVLANRGLRGLSRRLDGFDMPEEPTEAVKREAIDRWKQWYLMIRPDAQFLN